MSALFCKIKCWKVVVIIMEKYTPVVITIYGAEQICASCFNLPSSKDTYEWLSAALTRNFPDHHFTIDYVDILNPPEDEEKRRLAKKVIDEDLFYPVVFIGNKIIAEGNPRLKTIYDEMEKYGYKV